MNKKALSFVEILVSVAIIALLATVGLSYKNSYDDNKFNAKVESDLATLNNSFLSYKQENSSLPTAKSNDNFFKKDSSYAHDENDNAYGVHGYVTDNLIPKKYLNYLPLDPRTNQYYAYGKTLDPKNLQFEFAGVLVKAGEPESIVSGNFDGKALVGLIREYNGPQFIYNQSTKNFPYNPEERLMTAKIGSYSGAVSLEIDGNTYTNDILNKVLTSGDKIKINGDGFANIYYSDGSRSTIENDSELVLNNMNYKSDNNLLTQIQLNLKKGSIWTKATKLNPDGSQFEITTEDTTAAVRGTIFKVEKDKNSTITKVVVFKGEVGVTPIKDNEDEEVKIEKMQESQVSSTEVTTPTNSTEAIEAEKIPEILLPSNIKFQIKKIEENGTITIPQAKDYFYIKTGDKKGNNCNNTICTTTSGFTEIQICTMVGNNEENCSKKIKVKSNLSYENISNNDIQNIENQQNTEEYTSIYINGKKYNLYAHAEYNGPAYDGGEDSENLKKNYKLVDKYGNQVGDIESDLHSSNNYADNTGEIGCDSGKSVKLEGYGDSSLKKLEYTPTKDKSNTTCGHDLYDLNGTKGVIVAEDKYLKYTGLNDIGNNFIIEMSVRGKDLVRNDNDYFLFQTNNTNDKLQLYNKEEEEKEDKHNLSGKSNYIPISSYSGSINENQFYKVQYICEDGKQTIRIPGADVNSSHGDCYSFDTISIGSNKSSNPSGQWNGLIDYVKIYKRED